jgi:hypothetical protein
MKKGNKVKIISLPLACGYDHKVPNVKIGEVATILYIDGCCLCVKTLTQEFTANAERFELVENQ